MNLDFIKFIAQKRIEEINKQIEFLKISLPSKNAKINTDIDKQVEAEERILQIWNQVLYCLKYKQIINPSLLDFLKEEFLRLGLSNIKIIEIFEYIKIYNREISKKNIDNSTDNLLPFLQLLQQEFEEFPAIKTSNAENLDTVVQHTLDLLNNNELSAVENAINIDQFYQDNDLLYIYISILNFYKQEFEDFVDVVNNAEFSFSIELLNVLRSDYEHINERYLFMYHRYQALMKRKNTEIEKLEDVEEIDFESKNQRKLYYSSNSLDPEKCYFIKDLKGIREESLSPIQNLMEEFKAGSSANIKYLANRGFLELKKDQVRIIIETLEDDKYSVLGVFIKKDNNNTDTYRKIRERPRASINDEYSNQVENYYEEYIKNNSRKGSR